MGKAVSNQNRWDIRWIVLGLLRDRTCFTIPENCTQGTSISLWVRWGCSGCYQPRHLVQSTNSSFVAWSVMLSSYKYQGVKNFTLVARLGGEIPHLMQFSVATRKLCTLHCVLLNCNGTKCTGNALSIPAVAFSQQLLRETNFPQVAISLLVWSFHPMI